MGSRHRRRRGHRYVRCADCQGCVRDSLRANEQQLMYTILIGVPALGAKVIAAAGSQVKLDAVKKYAGADHLVDYSKPGWQKEVLKITSGHGVDVVYDPVGLIQGLSIRSPLSQWQKLTCILPTDSLKCIAWKGRAVVVGFAGGKIEKVVLTPPRVQVVELAAQRFTAPDESRPSQEH